MLVVPVAGLDDMAATIARATASIGEAPRKRFVGHLTIARVKANVADAADARANSSARVRRRRGRHWCRAASTRAGRGTRRCTPGASADSAGRAALPCRRDPDIAGRPASTSDREPAERRTDQLRRPRLRRPRLLRLDGEQDAGHRPAGRRRAPLRVVLHGVAGVLAVAGSDAHRLLPATNRLRLVRRVAGAVPRPPDRARSDGDLDGLDAGFSRLPDPDGRQVALWRPTRVPADQPRLRALLRHPVQQRHGPPGRHALVLPGHGAPAAAWTTST